MSKFKVGDKVRRVELLNSGMSEYFGGEPFEVQGPHDSYVVDPNGGHHGNDFLRPVEGPVRTVTRREVVDGVYGDVGVSVHPDGEIQIEMRMLTKDAKRVLSAAMILSQIAEALDKEETTK